MIHVLSGKGITNVAGVIRVSYPANSTLVITGTSSGKQFAKDINTTSSAKAYIFLAPIGDASYTLTATNTAGETVSKQVYVAKDQVQSVTLAYFSATIKVTYPAKSKCIIKNSSGTQVGSDTNTGTAAKTWTATVGATGTYTITATATDGGKTKSTTVSITADGQNKSVVLAYELIIYNAGSFGKNTDGTMFEAKNSDDNNASSITKNSAYMLWECGENAWCIFYINPKVSCAGYKTLKISVTNASTVIDSGEGKGRWGLKSNNNYTTDGFVAQTNFTSLSGSQTLSLDVSNVGATAYYVALQFGTPALENHTGSFSARVTKIWLE